MVDQYNYFCLVGFDTEVKDTDCIIRSHKETKVLEFCNKYRSWTEDESLRMRFLGGDNMLETIDESLAKEITEGWWNCLSVVFSESE